MSNPVLSVIIPAHNEEQLLHLCLERVTKQAFGLPYEIIVIDNNSTDQTAKIARSWHVRLVSEKRKGASAARNRGASVARANLLVFIDADCIVPYNHLATIWRKFSADETLDGLAGPYVYYDAGPFQRWLTDDLNSQSVLHGFYKNLFGLQTFISANFAIRKHIYRNVGGFDETITDVIEADDAEFACRLAKNGHRVLFDPALKILSSARRYKAALGKVLFTRTLYVLSYLIATKFAMLMGPNRPANG